MISEQATAEPSPTRNGSFAKEAEFEDWLEKGKKGVREAVIYDQYYNGEHIVRYVTGTRQEILDQYIFYKDAYPDKSLGLVCKEYYEQLIEKK